jgi:hypothetical protein
MRVQLVEALVPDLAVHVDPIERLVERINLEVAWPELGIAPP